MAGANRRPEVGKEVDSWCTRCKMDLGHTVVAMVGAQVVQVMCRTCNSYHRYRAPKSAGGRAAATASQATGSSRASAGSSRSAGGSSSRAASKAAAASGPGRWQLEVETAGGLAELASVARPYTIRESFEQNEWVVHSKFGLGKVLEPRPPDKVEILFKDGAKTLIMNRGA